MLFCAQVRHGPGARPCFCAFGISGNEGADPSGSMGCREVASVSDKLWMHPLYHVCFWKG